MNDSDSFFGSANSSAAYASRPRAVNPKTGQEQSWQRASNYAAPLDSPHGLIKWQMRELVKGISQRPDLARMLLTGAVINDNAKADEIIAAAHATQAIDAKANEGTAVHAALTNSFLGISVVDEYRPHITTFADTLRRNGLKPVATEMTLLNTVLSVIGHVDWVVETTDGRFLVLDVKTGKLGDSKRKFAVQCVCYAGAEYWDNGDGVSTEPIPFKIDQTEAILAHVDPETGATALYRVDLVLGLYGATLAERVRQWDKVEVLSPYTPAHPAIPVVSPAGIAAAHHLPASVVGSNPKALENHVARTLSAEAALRVGEHPESVSLANHVEDARAPGQVGAVYSSAHQQTFPSESALEQAHGDGALYAPDGTPVPATNEHGGSVPVKKPRTFDELMKLDKAPLQMIIKNEFGGSDIAHNRKWLARWIVARQGGADERAAAKFAAAKDDGEYMASKIEVVKTGAQPFIPQPETGPGSREFLLRSIAGANSVAALEALRANVVERRGDQAWTDGLAQAARERAAELGATAYQESPGDAAAALTILGRIEQATEPAHIAAIWNEVTIGGSDEQAWAPFKKRADERMIEIHQAFGAPPANPYA